MYGYTSNPYNRDLSSGGSSGGESALLALRGSPLGVGTDVGGSIRELMRLHLSIMARFPCANNHQGYLPHSAACTP